MVVSNFCLIQHFNIEFTNLTFNSPFNSLTAIKIVIILFSFKNDTIYLTILILILTVNFIIIIIIIIIQIKTFFIHPNKSLYKKATLCESSYTKVESDKSRIESEAHVY
jgi:hypothetical protein